MDFHLLSVMVSMIDSCDFKELPCHQIESDVFNGRTVID